MALKQMVLEELKKDPNLSREDVAAKVAAMYEPRHGVTPELVMTKLDEAVAEGVVALGDKGHTLSVTVDAKGRYTVR